MQALALIDDSAIATSVLRAARGIAALAGLTVVAIHAQEEGQQTAPVGLTEDLPLHVLDGDPERVLLEAVESPHVRLAVLGSRTNPEDPRPTGHLAELLLSSTLKPLLLVGPGCQLPADNRFRHALVPLDGSPGATLAARETLRLFGQGGLDVLALHVFDERTVPSFFDQPQHEFPRLVDELARQGGNGTSRIAFGSGSAAPAVVAAANTPGIDLVVLSWSRRLRPGHGQVIREALSSAEVPILLLPLPIPDTVQLETAHPDHENTAAP